MNLLDFLLGRGGRTPGGAEVPSSTSRDEALDPAGVAPSQAPQPILPPRDWQSFRDAEHGPGAHLPADRDEPASSADDRPDLRRARKERAVALLGEDSLRGTAYAEHEAFVTDVALAVKRAMAGTFEAYGETGVPPLVLRLDPRSTISEGECFVPAIWQRFKGNAEAVILPGSELLDMFTRKGDAKNQTLAHGHWVQYPIRPDATVSDFFECFASEEALRALSERRGDVPRPLRTVALSTKVQAALGQASIATNVTRMFGEGREEASRLMGHLRHFEAAVRNVLAEVEAEHERVRAESKEGRPLHPELALQSHAARELATELDDFLREIQANVALKKEERSLPRSQPSSARCQSLLLAVLHPRLALDEPLVAESPDAIGRFLHAPKTRSALAGPGRSASSSEVIELTAEAFEAFRGRKVRLELEHRSPAELPLTVAELSGSLTALFDALHAMAPPGQALCIRTRSVENRAVSLSAGPLTGHLPSSLLADLQSLAAGLGGDLSIEKGSVHLRLPTQSRVALCAATVADVWPGSSESAASASRDPVRQDEAEIENEAPHSKPRGVAPPPARPVPRVALEIDEALRAGRELELPLSELVRRNLGEGASTVAKKLASTWVRNAGKFVFPDPHQWIVELAVNGVDASGARPFGQFGIGFMSCLSFLGHAETGGVDLDVRTTRAGRSFGIQLQGEPTSPNVRFTPATESPPRSSAASGTELVFSPRRPGSRFDAALLAALEKQLYVLDFHEEARIVVRREREDGTFVETAIGQAPEGSPIVHIELRGDAIRIRDEGSGMDPIVAATKLLVPSASTKRARSARRGEGSAPSIPPARSVRFRGKGDDQTPHFLVRVGGKLVIDRPVGTGAPGSPDLLISLPDSLRYTLAGDEIAFSHSDRGEERRALLAAIDRTIDVHLDAVAKGELDPAEGSNRLVLLHEGLEAWERTSASRILSTGFASQHLVDHLRAALAKRPSVVPVEAQLLSTMEPLLRATGRAALVVSPRMVDHDFSRLSDSVNALGDAYPFPRGSVAEELRTLGARGGLVADASVVFVPDESLPKSAIGGQPLVGSFGLEKFVLAPRSMLEALPRKLEDGAWTEVRRTLAHSLVYRAARELGALDEAAARPRGDRAPFEPPAAFVRLAREPFVVGAIDMQWFPDGLPPAAIDELWAAAPLFRGPGLDAARAFWRELHAAILAGRDDPPDDGSAMRRGAPSDPLAVLFGEGGRFRVGVREALKELLPKLEVALDSPGAIRGPSYVTIVGEEPSELWSLDVGALLRVVREGRLRTEGGEDEGPSRAARLAKTEAALAMPGVLVKLEPERLVNHLFHDLTSRFGLGDSSLLVEARNARPPRGHDRLATVHGRFAAMARDDEAEAYVGLGSLELWPFHAANPTTEGLLTLFGALAMDLVEMKAGVTGDPASARERLRLPGLDSCPALQRLAAPTPSLPSLSLATAAPSQAEAAARSLESLAFVFRRQKLLAPAFKGLDAVGPALSSEAVFRIASAEPGVRPETREAIEGLRSSFFHLFERHLDVPDGLFPVLYGHRQFDGRTPRSHFAVEDVAAGLLALQEHVDAQQKAFLLIRRDLADRFGETRRARDAYASRLAVPHLFAQGIVEELARLRIAGLRPELLAEIVDAVENHEQLLLVLHLLGAYLSDRDVSALPFAVRSAFVSSSDPIVLERSRRAIREFVKSFVLERLDPTQVRAWYEAGWDSGEAFGRNREDPNKLSRPMLQALASTMDGAIRCESSIGLRRELVPEDSVRALAAAEPWSLKQLIAAHAVDGSADGRSLLELLSSGELRPAIGRIREASADLDLGKVRENVENASERDAIQGIVGETLQNSIDAVTTLWRRFGQREPGVERSRAARLPRVEKESPRAWDRARIGDAVSRGSMGRALPPRSSIEIDLRLVPEPKATGMSSVLVEVRDPAGMMDLGVLLTDFLLPDYSQKKRSEGAIGEMGNGLGILFQEAEEVFVTTRTIEDPTRSFLLSARPIRDPGTGMVEDLEVRVIERPRSEPATPEDFGTKIAVRLSPQSHSAAEAAAIHAAFFVRESCGAMSRRYDDGESLEVALSTQDGQRELVAGGERSPRALCRVETAFGAVRVSVLADPALPTQVTTGGLPFKKLSAFARAERLLPTNLLPELLEGFAAELPVGSYDPVQSRTRLRLQPEAKVALRSSLLEGLLLRELERARATGDRSKLESWFLHLGSGVGDWPQLRYSGRSDDSELVGRISDAEQPYNLQMLFTHFRPSFLAGTTTPSFAFLLEEAYRTLVPLLDAETNRARAAWSETEGRYRAELRNATDDEARRKIFNELRAEASDRAEALGMAHRAIFDRFKSELRDERSLRRRFQGAEPDPEAIEKLGALLDGVLLPWFENKLGNIPMPFPVDTAAFVRIPEARAVVEGLEAKEVKAKLEAIPGTGDPRALLSVGRAAVEEGLAAYVRRLLQHADDERMRTPGVKLDMLPPGVLGDYSPIGGEIRLGIGSRLTVSKALRLLLDVADGGLLTKSQLARSVLLPIVGDSGTLNHEAHHARTMSQSGHHGPTVCPDGELADFEISSVKWLRAAIEDGLLEDWAQDLREIVRGLPEDYVDWLRKAQPVIERLERDAPGSLWAAFGLLDE